MSDKPPSPPETPPTPPPSVEPTSDTSLIPFVTEAFNNLFNQLNVFTQELQALKSTVENLNRLFTSRLKQFEPQFQEILSNLREQRRSSVTHYSQLAATVAQGFEGLGELRSASTDKQTLDLLTETLQAAQDALYCLRMERLIRRYLEM